MGTIIEAVGSARGRRGLGGPGTVKLADEAAAACLAHRTAADLDFLVSAGVYRDKNMGEPAIASLIQEDIGANPDPPLRGGHGTFSFDVVNGPCGVLNGMHILDGFLSSGAIELGMVVAADAPPEPLSASHFPFAAASGACLLARDEHDESGFAQFAFATYSEFAHLFDSRLLWHEAGAVRRALASRVSAVHPGRHALHIDVQPGYAARCAECGVATAARFLAQAGLTGPEVDLLITSPGPHAFPDALARGLGVREDCVARSGEGSERVHTAGILLALQDAMRSNRLREARNVLLVTVGAGITVGCALYHP